MIEPSELLYAVGQGALAVECRVNDVFVLNILSKLCDFKTQCRILAERSFLKTLGGGCSAPVGINSEITESISSIEQEYTLTATGGVWSLNGQEEVVDEVALEFKLENGCNKKKPEDNGEDDLDVSPTKRKRLSDEGSAKGSPEIIDESANASASGKNATELVNIHGKVFDVCPYSGQSKGAKSEDETKDCPVQNFQLPIGQDFMGECPVLNTEQKILFDSGASGSGGDGLKCPIAGKVLLSASTTEGIDKCPFLIKQKHETVEMIDYEANALKEPKPDHKSLIVDLPDVKLFCGFFCHDISLKPIFDQCEELGVELAKKLISLGALDIMKVAQDEIHSKC